jgi:hypothetical protein
VNGNQLDNVLAAFSSASSKKPLVGSANKGSKLESALDRLGFQKRKVTLKENRKLKKEREEERERDRQTGRQTDRQTDRQRKSNTEKEER